MRFAAARSRQWADDGGLSIDALVAVEVAEQAADLVGEGSREASRRIGFVEGVGLRFDAGEIAQRSREARRRGGSRGDPRASRPSVRQGHARWRIDLIEVVVRFWRVE